MSVFKVQEIEVGIRRQRLTITGHRMPTEEYKYGNSERLDLDLSLARELLRLLTAAITLAEPAKPAAAPVALHEGPAA